ncbi:hypothetical protein [Photobacterium kishitanii]|uniref:hypothetical protein n=1 Tax=Photobacterium kishitanii TaxID=318456 RepID=UPI002739AD7C|nr:hypothetical protein [Photobacterium kishitanii]
MHIGQSVAIITDAGNPIGKAVALHFASLGATLALVDNNEVELKKPYNLAVKLMMLQPLSTCNVMMKPVFNPYSNKSLIALVPLIFY